jgi:hypothetical protein
VYPSPDNIDFIQYKDKADNCFRFKESRVSCPKNTGSVSKIPVQA